MPSVLSALAPDNTLAKIFRDALDVVIKILGGISKLPDFILNPGKAEADRQMTLSVKTDTNVKVDGPSVITLKLPNGMIAGMLNLTTSTDKGRTQVDSASVLTP